MADTIVPLDKALRIIDERTPARPRQIERLNLPSAFGRILASDAVSALDVPPFDKSAVDGYAIPDDGERGEYRLLKTMYAGEEPSYCLDADCAALVMTGAPAPPGTRRVVMVEDAARLDEIVHIERMEFGESRNICAKGEDARAGDVVAKAGQRLDAAVIAHLTGCGITEAEVFKPLRAAIVSTGDEIADDPASLRPGRIMNTNGSMLAALCRENGIAVALDESVRDDERDTREAIGRGMECADIILISGGVSAGERDFVPAAMESLGLQRHFRRVAVKPGKPTTFAACEGKAIFGLPGNPVAVYLMFQLMALRAAARMLGIPHRESRMRVPAAARIAGASASRAAFLPACIDDTGAVAPLPYHGSAHIGAVAKADGFVFIPSGSRPIEAGDLADFYIFRGRGM
ncbi:MAG: molybdopterin molybdotransferase MoeA [bacterium]|jgi:molybdopterin molybdotransferase